MPNKILLKVDNLTKTFDISKGWPAPQTIKVRAVDDVSFYVRSGEALGIVGESGCGKSTVAKTVLNLMEKDGGCITFDGVEIGARSGHHMSDLRRRIQIVFQDPASSLNPRKRIGDALGEPLLVHRLATRKDLPEKVAELLTEVGLPTSAADRFPHEFSGGQRQRIGIARALSLSPDLIFADEPVSALDVSVQAQILNLLVDLRERKGIAFVFISHDLGVVRHFCQRVNVMYLGRVVETGTTDEIFEQPLHPYTQLLKATSPVPDPEKAISMDFQFGDPPSPINPPKGCHFHPRCPRAMSHCRTVAPQLREVAAGRTVACHLYDR